jgi:glycosyl hydrolase family 16
VTVAAAPFRDGFVSGRLDPARWIPAYLPQWTTPERSAARYGFDGGRLVLEITPDTAPWCPDHDGDVRVSSIQTGVRSGPVGSPLGQHRFADRLTVVTAQEPQRLYVPRYGRISIRAAASADPRAMVALWMIGFEDRPEDSGEILVMEIFGRDVASGRAAIGMGVRPHHDPRLVDDFEQVGLDLDVTVTHEYVADWTPAGVVWSVDGREVRRSGQSPAYGMQLMLGLYAFEPVKPGETSLRFVVDEVRGDPPDLPGVTER